MVVIHDLIVLFLLSKWLVVGAADMDYMERSIRDYFSDTRHHYQQYKAYKEQAKQYIYNEFERFGLATEYHTFQDTNVSPGDNFHSVIGILNGTRFGTARDKIVGVAAHYDTVFSTKGVDDNGAGVAALLDVARQFSNMPNVKRQNTIMFISFDLEEYGGLSGSTQFVNSWWPNWLTTNYGSEMPSLTGVIVMDTVMEFNTSQHSQTIPDAVFDIFNTIFPDTIFSISSDNFEGDFLTLIYRKPTADLDLSQEFQTAWAGAGKSQYELETFGLPFTSVDQLPYIEKSLFRYFLRSDHTSFWRNNLTALFLTDTANFRGDMIQCYHNACDNLDIMLTDDNIEFLGKTSDSITKTLHKLSEPYDVTGGTNKSKPANILLTVIFLVYYVI